MHTEDVISIDPAVQKPIVKKAPVPERFETVTIPVSGMTCAACQGRVQRALEGEAGVKAASVNLMLKNAVITYRPATTSPETLVSVIRRTGYDADLPWPGRLIRRTGSPGCRTSAGVPGFET
jgi:Cu+-exporting ATPase